VDAAAIGTAVTGELCGDDTTMDVPLAAQQRDR
jgi:hypothetical protein